MASRYVSDSEGRVVLYRTAFLLAAVAAALASITERTAAAQEKKGRPPRITPERMVQVRDLLLAEDAKKLEELGPSANDVYLAILKDERSELFENAGYLVLDLVAAQKGDRSQFLPVARKLLSHKESGYRLRAAHLLGEIGGLADAPLLDPLLKDERSGVQTMAAAALAKIGTLRELEALDRLLLTKCPHDDDPTTIELTRSRDLLKNRLVAEKRIPPEKKKELSVDPEELKRVRELLRQGRLPPAELERAGSALNPIYLVILEDEKSGLRLINNVLFLLTDQKGDRSQFVPVVGRLLRHSIPEVREHSARLMGDIGGPADGSLLVPLLSDSDESLPGIQYAAGVAVAKIGTAHELEALEKRLKTQHPVNSPELLAHLTKCRDRLKARLDATKKPKD